MLVALVVPQGPGGPRVAVATPRPRQQVVNCARSSTAELARRSSEITSATFHECGASAPRTFVCRVHARCWVMRLGSRTFSCRVQRPTSRPDDPSFHGRRWGTSDERPRASWGFRYSGSCRGSVACVEPRAWPRSLRSTAWPDSGPTRWPSPARALRAFYGRYATQKSRDLVRRCCGGQP